MPETTAVAGRDLIELVAATFIASLSAGALALYALRRRSADVAALAFSAFAALYALRLGASTRVVPLAIGGSDAAWLFARSALTYVIIAAGAWFAEALLGRGWRDTLHWVRIITSAFAAIALAGMFLTDNAEWAMRVNNLLVLVFLGATALASADRSQQRTPIAAVRLGVLVAIIFVVAENLRAMGVLPWPSNVEFVGIVGFLAALALAVGDRFLQTEGRLAAVDRELATARRIQQRILPDRVPNLDRFEFYVRYVPMTEVAGDFYDFVGVSGRRGTVLVADVSGHGVPAALIASMVKIATASHRHLAADPGDLLTALSQSLEGQLGGQFVTAMCVHVDGERGVGCSGAGHPPLLHWRAGEERLTSIASDGILIGVTPASYLTSHVSVGPGDRLIVYTDGVLEVTNAAGAFFGDERFHTVIVEHATRSGSELADAILAEMRAWSGRREGFEDDVTLIVVGVR